MNITMYTGVNMSVVQYHPQIGYSVHIPSVLANAYGIEKGDNIEFKNDKGRLYLEITKKEA